MSQSLVQFSGKWVSSDSYSSEVTVKCFMQTKPSVWFGLVYLFIHSVTHITLETSITHYNLYITTQLIIYEHPHNIINNNTKFTDQLVVEFVTTSRYMCMCIYTNIPQS
jgi:hypothetical protein